MAGEIYGRGWRRDRLDHRDAIYRLQLPASSDPVDDRQDIDLTRLAAFDFPIYDQGQTNSCVAQATARNVEYLMRAQGVLDFHPSRLFIYWNARMRIGETQKDNGCEIRDGFKVIATMGVPHESDWPFEASLITKTPPAKYFKTALQHVALIHQKVPQKLSHILHCLKHNLPVVFGASTFPQWDRAKEGAIEMPSPGDEPTGGHAIIIVGWNAEARRFIFDNSWSSRWGVKGRGSIPSEYVLNSDLASDVWSAFLMSKTDEEKRRKEK